jgi:hypothetical protein
MSAKVKTINLEAGFPSREEAYQRLEDELQRAKKDHVGVLKIIHGYGSSGSGGVLRYAVRNFLRQKKEAGVIAAFISGESFSSFDERSKLVLRIAPNLLMDKDLGAANRGITVVLL